MVDLYCEFNKLMPSITLLEYMNMPKTNCIITGLNTHFGRGKSPFKVLGVIILEDVAHVYVGGRKYGSSKWMKKLRKTFGVSSLVYYTTKISFFMELWKFRDVFTSEFISILETRKEYKKYHGLHPHTFRESLINVTPSGSFIQEI